jgi:hypothetical protein
MMFIRNTQELTGLVRGLIECKSWPFNSKRTTILKQQCQTKRKNSDEKLSVQKMKILCRHVESDG